MRRPTPIVSGQRPSTAELPIVLNAIADRALPLLGTWSSNLAALCQLFFDVTAKTRLQARSTVLLPQSGHATL